MEHSKVETQDVEFNSNGKMQDEHSFSLAPKHSKHLLVHTIFFYYYWFVCDELIVIQRKRE